MIRKKEGKKKKEGREGGRQREKETDRQKDGQQTDIILAYRLRKEAC